MGTIERIFSFIVFVLYLWSSYTVFALEPGKAITQYGHETWLVERGLPQNSVSAVLQTSDGYIWLGTQKGLVRFDGVHFKVFKKCDNRDLKNNEIRCLYEDRAGVLWIGTAAGLAALKNGAFISYAESPGLPHNQVKCILEDHRRNLWVGTYGGGLSCLVRGKFKTYGVQQGLANPRIWALCEDQEKNLWIGTEGGLYYLKDERFRKYPDREGFVADLVFSLFEDSQGGLWIGTNRGISRFKDGKFVTFTTEDGLSHNLVSCIYEDRAGNLWIGTGGGLNRMKDGKFTAFTTREGLPGNHVISICEDKEGSLWLGIIDGGLHRMKDVNFTTWSSAEGLSHDMIWTVYGDSGGDLWIGTGGGTLDRMRDWKCTSYDQKDGLVGNFIYSIFEDRHGSCWVGTEKALNRFLNSRFKNYTTREGLSNNVIMAILEDRSGNLWIGTKNGLNRYKDGIFSQYFTGHGLAGDQVTSILEDQMGHIWIGTLDGGLSCLQGDEFVNYTTREGLSNNSIHCLSMDNERVLWIGTDGGGLNRLQGGSITFFTSQNGLFNDSIYQVLEDNQGNLWMSCYNGIFSVSKRELQDFTAGKIDRIHCNPYNEADGMKSRVCNGGSQPAGCKSKDGKLCFPTIKGVVMIDPNRLRRNTLVPLVKIEEVIVDGEEINPCLVPSRKEFVFSEGKKRFEFRYTALSFLNPAKVRFKYKLDGYDKSWIDAGSSRSTNYIGIPPGNYTFRVIACNNDGLWNNKGASFSFYLKPFFYQTWWFLLFCALALVLVGFLIARFRVQRLKTRKEELEFLVIQRTRELDKMNRELRKLATLDGLTGIYNYRWFSDFLDREWRRSIRDKKSIAVVLIDVDFFKFYNDTYGHQAGDECLKRIAQKLKQVCRRPGDVVARYGGEEFISVFSDTPLEEAAALSERMRSGIEELKIPHEISAVHQYVTISLGSAAVIPRQGDDTAALVKTADEALYQSKLAGRNRVTVKNPPLSYGEPDEKRY